MAAFGNRSRLTSHSTGRTLSGNASVRTTATTTQSALPDFFRSSLILELLKVARSAMSQILSVLRSLRVDSGTRAGSDQLASPCSCRCVLDLHVSQHGHRRTLPQDRCDECSTPMKVGAMHCLLGK